MKLRFLLLSAFTFMFFQVNAQFGKLDDTDYHMGFYPSLGILNTKTDISHGVNPNLTIDGKKLCWGLDWTSSRWSEVEDNVFIPKIQVPMSFRYMKITNSGLELSDGTTLPQWESSDAKHPALSYFGFSTDIYISPFYFKAGPVFITPRFGVGFDLSNHSYEIDLAKFVGKTGTNTNIPSVISADHPSLNFFNVAFWEDLYGINLGTYVNVGKKLFFTAGWNYYPGRFISKAVGNSVTYGFGDSYYNNIKANSAKLTRINLEGKFIVTSWFAVFARYENSTYKYETPSGIGTVDVTLLERKPFQQKDSGIFFGIIIGGPR